MKVMKFISIPKSLFEPWIKRAAKGDVLLVGTYIYDVDVTYMLSSYGTEMKCNL